MAYKPVAQMRQETSRRQQYRMLQRARFAADPSIAVHGKPSTYTNYGCRCDLCKAAGVAAAQDYRVRARARRALARRENR